MAAIPMASFLDSAARTVTGMMLGRQQANAAFQAEQDVQSKLEEQKVKQQELEADRAQREALQQQLAESLIAHRTTQEKQGATRISDAEANAKQRYELRRQGLDQQMEIAQQRARQGDVNSLRQMYTALSNELFSPGYMALSPEDQAQYRDWINARMSVIGPQLGQGLSGQPAVPGKAPAGATAAAPSPLAKALAAPVPKKTQPTVPQALAAKREAGTESYRKATLGQGQERINLSKEAGARAERLLQLTTRRVNHAISLANKKFARVGAKASPEYQRALSRITSPGFAKEEPAQKQLALEEYLRQAHSAGVGGAAKTLEGIKKLAAAPAAAGGKASQADKQLLSTALKTYAIEPTMRNPLPGLPPVPNPKFNRARQIEAGHDIADIRMRAGVSPEALVALNPDYVPHAAPKPAPKPAPTAPKRAAGGVPVLPKVTSLKGIPAPAAATAATSAARTTKASAPAVAGTTPPGPTKATQGKVPKPLAQMDPQLKALAMKGLAGAEKEGLHPIIEPLGGVRSAADQKKLYDNRANNPNYIAPPGTSGHEAGQAVDITAGVKGTHEQKMAAQQQLARHMAPQGWRWAGENEAMHFTYVGKGNNPYPDDTRHSNLWKAMVDNNADVNALLRSRKTTEDKQHMSELIKEIQQVVHQANPGIQFRDVPLKTQAIEWPQGVDRVNSLMVRWNGRTLPYRVEGNRGIILTPSGKFDMAGVVY